MYLLQSPITFNGLVCRYQHQDEDDWCQLDWESHAYMVEKKYLFEGKIKDVRVCIAELQHPQIHSFTLRCCRLLMYSTYMLNCNPSEAVARTVLWLLLWAAWRCSNTDSSWWLWIEQFLSQVDMCLISHTSKRTWDDSFELRTKTILVQNRTQNLLYFDM